MPITHVRRPYRRMGGTDTNFANRAPHESHKEVNKELKTNTITSVPFWQRIKSFFTKELIG